MIWFWLLLAVVLIVGNLLILRRSSRSWPSKDKLPPALQDDDERE